MVTSDFHLWTSCTASPCHSQNDFCSSDNAVVNYKDLGIHNKKKPKVN